MPCGRRLPVSQLQTPPPVAAALQKRPPTRSSSSSTMRAQSALQRSQLTKATATLTRPSQQQQQNRRQCKRAAAASVKILCTTEPASWVSGEASISTSAALDTTQSAVAATTTAAAAAAATSTSPAIAPVGISPPSQLPTIFKDPSSPSLEASGGDNNGNAGLPPEDGNNGRGGGDSGGEPSQKWPSVLAFLLRGVRGRLEADPFFGHKLAVECGLDAAIIMGVNYNVRRERFFPEIEFTLCQLAISLFSDFALVYLLAPSTFRTAAAAGTLRARLAALPAHVFQHAGPGVPAFTPAARIVTLLLKSFQYGGVGFAMGCLGASAVQGLVGLRERLDSTFEPPATVQSVVGTGTAWCTFMATSSNVRYNLVNAAEDALYRRGALTGKLGSVALRLMNNWAGAAQWVAVTDKLDLEVPWKPRREQPPGKKRRGKQQKNKTAAA